jgi:hypothetical protein
MTEKTLTVITPSMRTLRLPTVSASIAAAPIPDGWNLRWLVGINPPWALPWKVHIARWDALLDSVHDGYWIIVADDNLLDARLPQAIADHFEAATNPPTMMLFGGRVPAGHVRIPTAAALQAGSEFDTGQAVVEAAWWRSLGWSWDEFGQERFLLRKLWELCPERTILDPRPFTMYDGQRNLL